MTSGMLDNSQGDTNRARIRNRKHVRKLFDLEAISNMVIPKDIMKPKFYHFAGQIGTSSTSSCVSHQRIPSDRRSLNFLQILSALPYWHFLLFHMLSKVTNTLLSRLLDTLKQYSSSSNRFLPKFHALRHLSGATTKIVIKSHNSQS